MTDRPVQNSSSNERCASCGSARNKGDRCDYCGGLYPDMINAKPKRQTYWSLDKKYEVKRGKNRVKITWNWKSPLLRFLAPFFAFWNLVAFSFGATLLFVPEPMPLFPIPGIHMVIGVFGGAYVILCLINNSTITADRRRFSFKHHPLHWPGNFDLPASDVVQIFVSKERRSSKRHTWDVPVLYLVTNTGKRYHLLRGHNEVEFADYESLRRYLLDALDIEPGDAIGAAES